MTGFYIKRNTGIKWVKELDFITGFGTTLDFSNFVLILYWYCSLPVARKICVNYVILL